MADDTQFLKTTRRGFFLAGAVGGLMQAQENLQSTALQGFGPEAQSILTKILSGSKYRGQFEVSEVEALRKAEQVSRDALMLKLIPIAKSFAHPPLSNYFVGAVACGSSGRLYLGCNIEIPGNMLGLAVHGEQAAIANAYMSEESGIDALTVGGAPCGHCRQFLSEVSLEVSMRLIMRDGSSVKLLELLPHPFGPKNLGFTRGSFPVPHTGLTALSNSSDALANEAWRAACNAYSPYSRSPSGVALLTDTGRIFSGSYIENAAFNPSLPPLETALAGYFAAGAHAGAIQRAVLVELEKSGISHRVTTGSVLGVLAPSVRLERISLSS